MSEFERVGVLTLAASGRSFKIKLFLNREVFYVSVKNTLEVLDRHKKNVQVVRRVAKMQRRSCESRPS